jgi:predicted HicB family RNase H-like nuclease
MLTDEQHAALAKEARDAGVSVAELVRSRLAA